MHNDSSSIEGFSLFYPPHLSCIIRVKDLAAAIAIEAAELQEIFLWKQAEPAEMVRQETEITQHAREELADIAIFLLSFADVMEIDVAQAIVEKLETNAKKYPVEKAQGRATKYDEL